VGTNRLEAFSDGVFAVAITLLVLDIKVPHVSEVAIGKRLLQALLDQWPVYLAFVTSFLSILIMWVNHHNIFRCIDRTDHQFLIINGLLLMGITFVPLPTALVSEYLLQRDAHVAAAVYGATYMVIALLFNLLWWYAIHQDRLLAPDADRQFVKRLSRGYRFGPLLYFAVFMLAFVSAPASLALSLALAVFFALPTSR